MLGIDTFKKIFSKNWNPSPTQNNLYSNFLNNANSIAYIDQLLDATTLSYNTKYDIAKNHPIVSHAIKIILQSMSNIDIVLKRINNDGVEVINDGDIVDLLNNPNGLYEKTEIDLFRRLCFEYIVNGEFFVFYDQEYKILESISCNKVNTILIDTYNNFPLKYQVTHYSNSAGKAILQFEYDTANQYYISTEGFILYHYKYIENDLFDMKYSKSAISANKHLINIYTNALNSLYAITSKALNNNALTINYKNQGTIINSEYTSNLQKEIALQLSNTVNSGRTTILNDVNADFSTHRLNALEYDQFSKMFYDIESKLYKALGVPLALIDQSAMKYDNINSAQIQIYEETIFPMLKIILSNIQVFLFNIFDLNNAVYYFDIDRTGIEAFQDREISTTTNLFEKNIITRNEARSMLGMSPLPPESGDIFLNNNQQNIDNNLGI